MASQSSLSSRANFGRFGWQSLKISVVVVKAADADCLHVDNIHNQLLMYINGVVMNVSQWNLNYTEQG